MSEHMDQDTPEADAARQKMEDAFVEFIRVVLGEDEGTPIILDGYLFQLQATKFDPNEEDGRMPLVWGHKESQSVVTTLGLVGVLERNIEIEMDELNDD